LNLTHSLIFNIQKFITIAVIDVRIIICFNIILILSCCTYCINIFLAIITKYFNTYKFIL